MPASPRPHDALFRALLDDPRRAAALIHHHLPPALAARLSTDPPEPLEGTFVDPELRETRSDRLFRLSTVSGRPALLYVLLEHKSNPDPGTPLQLLGYMVRIWQRHAGRNGGALTALPPIIPLVFYHGADRWTVPGGVLDCLDVDKELRPWVEGFRYILRDLGPIPYEQLAADRAVRAALGALKYAAANPVTRAMLARLLADLPDGDLLELQILRYIAIVYEVRPADLDAAIDLAKPNQKERLMPTLAEVWTQEGLEKGLAQGLAQGLEKGLAQGKAEMLLRLVRLRFGDAPPGLERRIRSAATNDLERWGDGILTATSLDSLFGPDPSH